MFNTQSSVGEEPWFVLIHTPHWLFSSPLTTLKNEVEKRCTKLLVILNQHKPAPTCYWKNSRVGSWERNSTSEQAVFGELMTSGRSAPWSVQVWIITRKTSSSYSHVPFLIKVLGFPPEEDMGKKELPLPLVTAFLTHISTCGPAPVVTAQEANIS